MKILNKSDEFINYSRDQHIDNLKGLSKSRALAVTTGTGTGGVDSIIKHAIITAYNHGLTVEEISTYINQSTEEVISIVDGSS